MPKNPSPPQPQLPALSYPLWPDGCRRLGVSRTRGFGLAASGLWETFKIGKRRQTTDEATRKVLKLLQDASERGELPRPAVRRKRGKPKKSESAAAA